MAPFKYTTKFFPLNVFRKEMETKLKKTFIGLLQKYENFIAQDIHLVIGNAHKLKGVTRKRRLLEVATKEKCQILVTT
jgi:hypothetical protein